ncbi:hypothetical protein SAMN06296273_2692 [Nitrosomonas ureae]|uniref:Uncharacterized protein n=1 Tax=Nitrosomonas ureae TaxID=44577 RepID=A0A285C0Z0_9PROT|nr:hypothetical protein [Nitrosomonas ureae]SNX61241.1 hypothetical protein SAMN06296273_2692 [Nitrosomonas ureae]
MHHFPLPHSSNSDMQYRMTVIFCDATRPLSDHAQTQSLNLYLIAAAIAVGL